MAAAMFVIAACTLPAPSSSTAARDRRSTAGRPATLSAGRPATLSVAQLPGRPLIKETSNNVHAEWETLLKKTRAEALRSRRKHSQRLAGRSGAGRRSPPDYFKSRRQMSCDVSMDGYMPVSGSGSGSGYGSAGGHGDVCEGRRYSESQCLEVGDGVQCCQWDATTVGMHAAIGTSGVGACLNAAGSDSCTVAQTTYTYECPWVANNINTMNERYAGDVSSKSECIDLVRETCPDATIANVDIDVDVGGGDATYSCWCQFGRDMTEVADARWTNCLLANASVTSIEEAPLPDTPAPSASPYPTDASDPSGDGCGGIWECIMCAAGDYGFGSGSGYGSSYDMCATAEAAMECIPDGCCADSSVAMMIESYQSMGCWDVACGSHSRPTLLTAKSASGRGPPMCRPPGPSQTPLSPLDLCLCVTGPSAERTLHACMGSVARQRIVACHQFCDSGTEDLGVHRSALRGIWLWRRECFLNGIQDQCVYN